MEETTKYCITLILRLQKIFFFLNYLQPGASLLSHSPLRPTGIGGEVGGEAMQTWAAIRDKHTVVGRFIAWKLQYC